MNEQKVYPVTLEQPVETAFYKQKTFWIGVIFLVSLAFRFEDFYFFREFNADKAHQLQAAYELLQGKGISLESYDLNTLKPHVQTLAAWPPAYSYIVAGISKLTSLSVFQASWALDVLTLAALWCVLLWFVFLLRFTLLQTGLLFLLVGYGRTPWVYLWSADILGSVLFLISAALNLSFFQPDRRKVSRLLFGVAQVLLILTMCFLKLSLLPAYVSLCVSGFSFAWKSDKKYYRTALFLFVAVFFSLGLLFLYNMKLAGNNTSGLGSLEHPHTGLFFSNLLMFSAFFLKSFFYVDGFLQKMQSHRLEACIQMLNIALIFFLLFYTGKKILVRKTGYFSHLVFWTTLCVCGFLTFLSLRYSQETFVGSYYWTYVKELRYFLPAIF